MEILGCTGRATQHVWLINQESEVAEVEARRKARRNEDEMEEGEKGEYHGERKGFWEGSGREDKQRRKEPVVKDK